jgi:drug/metabolite transporter (DMT)-like permease
MRRPRWVLGTLLLVLAWPLQVLALALAPITVVQPALASFPIALLLFARFWLREQVQRRDIAGVMTVVAGITLILVQAPRHTVAGTSPRLVLPLVTVGGAAVLAYVLSRTRDHDSLALTLGAGLAYAWVDFTNKLLSNAVSSERWLLSVLWLAAIVGMGALAFVQENTALQRRQAVQVNPLIGAIQDPLPVLMALWAGIESWGSGARRITVLAIGLFLAICGGFMLARSGTAERARAERPPGPAAGPPPELMSGDESSS